MNTNASQQPPSFKQACQQLIQPYGQQSTWVVGVSGGVDSTVLLHTLAQLKKTFPINLVACYVDHQWRKPPAPEIEPLWQQTQAWGIPLVIAPIPANTPQTETAARDARQQAFMAVVKRFNAKGVILAHHGDDQWETLLLRLFRGTGPNGLQGIQPISTVSVGGDDDQLTILHPFLHFDKDDLRTTAEMFELKWVEDSTNNDNQHKRNALRNEVIPAIEKHFPNIGEKLNQLATIATQQTQLANDAINIAWESVWNGTSLDMAAFFQLAPAYQTGLMMKLLSRHGLPASKKTLDTLATFLTSDDPQHSQSQQCSIEGPQDSEHHWFFTIRKHRGIIRNSSEEVTTPLNLQDGENDDDLIYGLPVKFRLAQLFPTWAGVGPANADNNAESSELDINDRLSDSSQLDENDDAEDNSEDTTLALDNTDSDIELENDTDDSDGDADEFDDDDLDESDDESDAEVTTDSDDSSAPTEEDELTEDEPREDEDSADAVVTLHTTRIQVIDLPEYQAELEIARLGPDEVIPSPLPPANSLTIYANLKPLVNDHLTIRYRRPSDRIHPIGMIAGMPIKNYFISQGIPPEQRSRQPLLCCQTDVLWAVGLGLNELLRANKKPTHRLTWRSVGPNPQAETEASNAPAQLVTA